MAGDRGAQFPESGSRRIMRGSLFEPINPCVNNRFWGIKVRLPDFQMDDTAALALQFCSAAKHLKCGLAAYIVHPSCDPVFSIQLQSIAFLANKMTPKYNIGPVLIMREGHVTGKWVRVAGLSELPSEGLGHAVKVEGLDIALFRWDD